MRKIVCVTGSRSEFGLLYSTLKAIDENSNLELSLIVTGMHLSREHGYTLDFVRETGLKIAKVIDIGVDTQESNLNTPIFFGKFLIEITKALDEIKPDILLIEGDRFEKLPAAIAAAHLNIPVAHACGGDVSKSIDDSTRHSITKFAHIHLPGSYQSAERIIKMGEEPWRVFMTGTPLYKEYDSKEELERKIGVDFSKETILVLQHPVSTEFEKAGEYMELTLKVVRDLNKQVVVIYPSNDPGSDKIIEAIKRYEYLPNFHVFKNLSPEVYMGILRNVSLMVGNSSSGIVETPMFKLPCINIGIREEGRERAGNVIDVPHDEEKIREAISLALSNEFKEKLKDMVNPYHSENVEKNICEVLEEIELGEKLLNKKMTY
ncbi:MAG: UDP-N-acetylglucosamine 2-epimerase [Candidatus Woesearchaeota archaeon]